MNIFQTKAKTSTAVPAATPYRTNPFIPNNSNSSSPDEVFVADEEDVDEESSWTGRVGAVPMTYL